MKNWSPEIKNYRFLLKNSPTVALPDHHRYRALIRSQIPCIPRLEDKKIPGGIKKIPRSKVKIILMPSYLFTFVSPLCYLEKINSWSGKGRGEDLDLRSTHFVNGDERFQPLEFRKKKKRKEKEEKNNRQKLCAPLESSVIFFLIKFTAPAHQVFNETLEKFFFFFLRTKEAMKIFSIFFFSKFHPILLLNLRFIAWFSSRISHIKKKYKYTNV